MNRAHDSQIVRAKENLKLSHGGLSHVMKLATMPKLGQHFKKMFYINIGFEIEHWGRGLYSACVPSNQRLILIYFTNRSNVFLNILI